MSPNEPIAIIGTGCRFPGGASSPSKLWDLLHSPRDVSTDLLTAGRFDPRGFYHPKHDFPGHSNVRRSYLLQEDVANFDARFFNLQVAEAGAMDPQQRILLETVYEGLEAAGQTLEGLKGSDTGVYVGMMYGDYESQQYRDLQSVPLYHGTGVARSMVSNRISYFFDWHGPSLTVDTACSSSLVALHQAIQSLRSGEVTVAVAAGTNLLLGPEPYIYESNLKMLSPDGRSRMWGDDANGYARGDGVAAVVLKTLSQALADGDHIECVVRESGVNQDGRSPGITMPTAKAQVALIRDVYTRAGLDLASPADRCQYVEAHGTGTPAGDPIEAEAIHTAFFQDENGGAIKTQDADEIVVGSIKTVIGHTESTAGIAAIIKVAQALKHGHIPPNGNRILDGKVLDFTMNPRVEPWCSNLRIANELTRWPELAPGQCRRASINSFGFGGTNAHVILESLGQETLVEQAGEDSGDELMRSFVFSAQSKQSLIANLAAHAAHLSEHPDTRLDDLAWTLRSRRSRFPLRVALSASSVEMLRTSLEEIASSELNKLQLDQRLKLTTTGSSAGGNERKTKLLAIFTGQGAQWARMGAQLVENSKYASDILSKLDAELANLPNQEDRPDWTLRQELLADSSQSRVGDAAISQPLCTAVQVILVDILREAGVEFAAVVGHSSGEIGAAYLTGRLSAADAIRIAYYRGLHSTRLAGGPDGTQGAMLAVSTSMEDASEVCSDEFFQGRVKVAACNSPNSVTLSGDSDAIEEIAGLFEDEGKTARRLRVDKAYHSHHMIPCSQPYLESMQSFQQTSCQAGVRSDCVWVSSVVVESDTAATELEASYWVDNLLSPVLFKQAVERAVMELGPFDGIVEVGPHPALKGPVRQILEELKTGPMPYTGLLERGTEAATSLSTALGYLWTHVDGMSINFDQYESALSGPRSFKRRFVAGLPLYQWNHSRHWHESNTSRRLRFRNSAVHPLLGDICSSSSPQNLSWKAVLRPQDIPWVHDHQIQGQSVFPAAGYAVTALEAAPFLADGQTIRLIEVEDLVIHQAMVFDNDDSSIEVRFSVGGVSRRRDDAMITGHFTYEYHSSNGSPELAASGQLRVMLGEPRQHTLPATDTGRDSGMVNVPTDVFYSSLSEMGYGYTGPFKALSGLSRKLGKAVGVIDTTSAEYDDASNWLVVHPGMLDAAIHSVILAYSYPRDGKLWSLHLPTRIKRLRVNPALCEGHWTAESVPFVSTIADDQVHTADRSSGFHGDVEIHSGVGAYSAIQVEGLQVVPFSAATSRDDRTMFYVTRWVNAEPDADIPGPFMATPEQRRLAEILERGHYFYLRQLEEQVPADHPGRLDQFYAAYLRWATHTHRLVTEGKHRYGKPAWVHDTLADIKALTEPYNALPEVKAMHVVGEQMPRAIRGETTMLQHLMVTGLLNDYYTNALGMRQVTVLADTVLQLTRRYPRANILEVGAGTGGATREVLKLTGKNFGSFTFTDVSAGFFDDAQAEFAPYQDQMSFRVLDLEQDTAPQGFEQHSYDVVVGSLVLHATKNLEKTLQRVRSLLRPGGYIVFYEITNVDLIRHTALFGCLPGWWQGVDEGRTWCPAVSESKWDAILRKTGFSGVDTMTPTNDSMPFCNSVLVSQAVDDWVDLVRQPLMASVGGSLFSTKSSSALLEKFFIVGGQTLHVSRLIDAVQKIIRPFCGETVTRVDQLEDLDHDQIDKSSTVLVLQDLDSPVFDDMTTARLESLKALFGSEKTIVWITHNRLVDNPHANMAPGFVRPSIWEAPELRYQFVDFQDVPGSKIDARALTEAVLRFQAHIQGPPNTTANALWSVESEIIIGADGAQYIPRLSPLDDANARYNSSLRQIESHGGSQQTPVRLQNTRGRYMLRKQEPLRLDVSTSCLKIEQSSLFAVRTGWGDVFAVSGACEATGVHYLGLTSSVTSRATVATSNLVEISDAVAQGASGPLMLTSVVCHLVLQAMEAKIGEHRAVVVHDAPPILAASLARSSNGKNITFTTSTRDHAATNDWIYIEKYAKQSDLELLFPLNVSMLIDFAAETPEASVLKHCFPIDVDILAKSSLFTAESSRPLISSADLKDVLQTAVALALKEANNDGGDRMIVDEVDIGALISDEANLSAHSTTTVVNWADAETSPVTVQPVSVSLREDRTYWLAGLSRDMGLSLADWIIRNGGKHIAISSRNPNISQAWLRNAARKGATVLVISCDITDYDSVVEAHANILKSLPPVAGVAQGAMVLNDTLTRDMSLEDLNKVLRPKVAGSINLDRLFHDSALDFFIFFSSAASVTGNAGQANYSAANFFMGGLAQKRRRRGLAASVIDLGPVLGTGYITREIGDALTRPLAERGLLGMSESDVHCLFAEAINASPVTPSSEVGWHITTGLIPLPADAPNRPLWYNFPHFASLTIRDSSAGDPNNPSNSAAGAVVSIKDQLAGAKTKEDVQNVITDNVLKEMCTMLHMDDDYVMTPAICTDELGLDSLVAVRIRSWFLSHFQVNVPALKIIKGVSLQHLIDLTLNEIPAGLTPGLVGAGSSTDGSEMPSGPEDEKSLSDTSSSANSPDGQSSATSETGESEIMMTPPPEKELEIERFGPLSHTQSVFRFVHELLEDKTTLNNTGMVHLSGEIRIPDLQAAVHILGKHHESLRTCFFTEDGVAIQGVLAEPTLELEHRRVFTKSDVLSEYDALKNTVFDLRGGHTARVLLLSYSPTDHYFALATHHITFDRASTDIFMSDLARIYKNKNESLPTPLQYLDYSNELHEMHSPGKCIDAMNFWRREFATIPEPLPLHRSSLAERRPLEKYSSRTGLPECEFRLDSQLTTQIRQIARKYRSTPFHFHLAAFKVLLLRWLGTEDVCIGFADGCRRDERMWTGIGPFLNMLPLRMKARRAQSFADAIAEAREKSHAALSNALPLEVILNELKVSRQPTHSPLAQAFINYAETSVESGREFLGCGCQMMKEDQAELPYDIAFTIITNTAPDGDADTKIILNAQTSLYNATVARILATGYQEIVREFAGRPENQVNDEWEFAPSSLSKAIAVGHGPDFQTTWMKTIVHRLDEILPSIGHRVAVTDAVNTPVTYQELSNQINSIASTLLREGVTAGSRVAICQHPTVFWVASVVAVLKVGAVYVPLDAATPPPRLALMVQDCKPAAVLVDESTREMVEDLAPEASLIGVSSALDTATESLPTTTLVDSPAMILYTSGSTGTPKGVVLSHESLRHEFEHCQAVYGLSEEDVVLQQSAWSFDLSITQLFLALTVGARLHVASHTLRADGRAMAALIRDEGVTATYATPTEYKTWLRDAHVDVLRQSPWKLALVAGEAVTVPLLKRFGNLDRADSLRLFNVYGPTETTCGSTKLQLDYAHPEKYADAVPVGRASANECFYILDTKQNPQPLGLSGEVVIGGVGVAKGYLNNADQTKVSFVHDRFATPEYTQRGWTTMYRTGDAGYLKDDGTLILTGRLSSDTEVKLNGVRTDLRDVEQTILKAGQGQFADVAACVRTNMSMSEDGDQVALKYMVAYCVLSTERMVGESSNPGSILQTILNNLPLSRAMRPSVLIPVDDLPRTTAGKLDRRALEKLEIAQAQLGSVGGATTTTSTSTLSDAEARLLRLWQSVLPEEAVRLVDIRASSDFFSVGGSSMLLVQLQHKITETYQASVTLLDLFKASTLSDMALVLQRALGLEANVPDATYGAQSKSIDWASETAFQVGVPMEDTKLSSPTTPPRVIVLTGATGFLGQHLLRGLLEQDQVEKVICIANRNMTEERKRELLCSPRVECLDGDLCAPNLGLSPDDADRIFGTEADAVIHNGADVSHLKTYASLRDPNVNSTKALALLCLQRHLPLHYVSTTGVTMYTTSSTFPEISVRDSPPPCDGTYGYISSKWASEVYLENVNLRTKLPVYIHRPSSVLRPDLGEETPAADVLQNMLTFSRRLCAVPIGPLLKGFVDLVRPETVTDRLLGAVMAPSRGEDVVYVHESGDIELEISHITSYLEVGMPIQQLELDEWVKRAEEMGLSSAMAAVFRGLGAEDMLNFPRLLRSV
ncbi:beta-ketoacyl synthase domain-containing protein [Aspergillus campestris IBT 28561]|uniref:Beta-ketoacyl synthase domain-containing protein n=1 Tax=Aspergillus campestris (strain IBT 28561) TaxID=1392248 RepID=A0A2I1CT76_ASPC2|nr:beta-ketoacyl synthase domain-containing protein [Aspergillus campestris IBT 28561]PKY00833.1 beta-ketoacyl synthase domain-containing protein [Aspergillus campestris IBT 28561]